MPGQSTASCVGKPVASMGPTPGVEPPALEPATAIPAEPLAASLPPALVLPWFSDLPAHPASASATIAIPEVVMLVPLLIMRKVSASLRRVHWPFTRGA